jgi:hypothetical protein
MVTPSFFGHFDRPDCINASHFYGVLGFLCIRLDDKCKSVARPKPAHSFEALKSAPFFNQEKRARNEMKKVDINNVHDHDRAAWRENSAWNSPILKKKFCRNFS